MKTIMATSYKTSTMQQMINKANANHCEIRFSQVSSSLPSCNVYFYFMNTYRLPEFYQYLIQLDIYDKILLISPVQHSLGSTQILIYYKALLFIIFNYMGIRISKLSSFYYINLPQTDTYISDVLAHIIDSILHFCGTCMCPAQPIRHIPNILLFILKVLYADGMYFYKCKQKYVCFSSTTSISQHCVIVIESNTNAISINCRICLCIYEYVVCILMIFCSYYYQYQLQKYTEYMDNLKIQGMFPTSISEISYVNEQSQFGGYSIANHKHFERMPDYHIKINAPQQKPHYLGYEQRNYGSDKQQRILADIYANDKKQYQASLIPKPSNQYNEKKTGYPLKQDTFSQQQIMKAFNIIDINKDNAITQDDLVFVLDYIKEDYTMQEVKQMINMLGSNNKVNYQQFKKLGKGNIIPLGKYKTNLSSQTNKATIMNNIQNSQAFKDDPEFYVECLSKKLVTYNKYQQIKKGAKTPIVAMKHQLPSKDKLCSIMPIRTKQKFDERKYLFLSIVTTSIANLMENFRQSDHHNKQLSILNPNKVCKLLQIQLPEYLLLYPEFTQSIQPLIPVLQSIIYSNENMYLKLQLCFQVISYQKCMITINQLIHLLQLLKGQDQSIGKKMRAILASKGLGAKDGIQKSLAYQIVLQYINKIFGL